VRDPLWLIFVLRGVHVDKNGCVRSLRHPPHANKVMEGISCAMWQTAEGLVKLRYLFHKRRAARWLVKRLVTQLTI